MICIFCGEEAPIIDRWSIGEERAGRVRRLKVENMPVCGACRVAIQERAVKNDAMTMGGKDAV
ncbi:MAG: hypothetical protein WBK88_07090 [Methanothrix sp.]